MIKVVGLEPVSYVNKSGVNVQGTKVYYTSDLSSPAIGVKCSEAFLSGFPISSLRLGDAITMLTEPTSYGVKYVGVLYVEDIQKGGK